MGAEFGLYRGDDGKSLEDFIFLSTKIDMHRSSDNSVDKLKWGAGKPFRKLQK